MYSHSCEAKSIVVGAETYFAMDVSNDSKSCNGIDAKDQLPISEPVPYNGLREITCKHEQCHVTANYSIYIPI